MGVQLRIVLDQLEQVVDQNTAEAALGLAAGLIRTAPPGCAVQAISCGGEPQLPGLTSVRTVGRSRAQVATGWQLGVAPGVGGGLIHSPTLMAPLVRHDRANDHDQTVVTLWDLRAWEHPSALPRTTVAWQRGMLKRAVRHADAVIVPSHAFLDRLGTIARFGDRARVVAGAAPTDFAVSGDASAVRAELSIPEEFVVLTGPLDTLTPGFRAAAALDRDAVVLDVAEGDEPRVADAAAAAGLPERRVHARGALTAPQRAAVLHGADILIASDATMTWPWRAVEALAIGVPIAAVDSEAHRDVLADGALLTDPDDLTDAAVAAAGQERHRVLSGDRGRAFSWQSAAERVWALHADL